MPNITFQYYPKDNQMKNLFNLFSLLKSDGSKELEAKEVSTKEALFALSYKNLLIGNLQFDNSTWIFEYSNDFKNQHRLRPITDFPDLDKQYQQSELWPFFSSRIPTKNQPMVQEALRKHSEESFDTVKMLEMFGKRTITNPYVLEVSNY